jgi:hypothetical protein
MTMKVVSNALGVLLLSLMMAAPMAVPGLVASAGAQQPPAGCHEDGGKVPSAGPVSHQCCQGAHHPAVLQQPSTPRPSLLSLALTSLIRHLDAFAGPVSFPNQGMASGDPPTVSPLRV